MDFSTTLAEIVSLSVDERICLAAGLPPALYLFHRPVLFDAAYFCVPDHQKTRTQSSLVFLGIDRAAYSTRQSLAFGRHAGTATAMDRLDVLRRAVAGCGRADQTVIRFIATVALAN